MLTRWLRRHRSTSPRPDGRALQVAPPVDADIVAGPPCGADCVVASCQLLECGRGHKAVVVRVDCDSSDACRLRALGVYEGARVDVVDSRNGLLLQVRGSRIALAASVAAAIAVIPVTS
jgi:Fe2+ transport system protein FeoA